MRAIKNFFHDINDILLAIIIVAVAAGVIYWRMGIILDYPRQLAAQQAAYEQDIEELDEEDIYDTEDEEDAETADEADGEAAEGEEPAAEPQG